MIGEKIRSARQSQERSLADVAKKAKISVATLSRIENDKQSLELGLFLTLAKVLDKAPNELLGDLVEEQQDGLDPLVKKIARFQTRERTALWRGLTAHSQRNERPRSRRAPAAEMFAQVEELLAQIEFMREELEHVRKQLRRPGGSR